MFKLQRGRNKKGVLVFCFFRGKEGIQMEQSVKPREGPLIVPGPPSPQCQAQLWLLQRKFGQRGGASDYMLSIRASELTNLHVLQYLVKKKKKWLLVGTCGKRKWRFRSVPMYRILIGTWNPFNVCWSKGWAMIRVSRDRCLICGLQSISTEMQWARVAVTTESGTRVLRFESHLPPADYLTLGRLQPYL